MADSTSERDWKYMRSIRDDILAALCDRINCQSEVILKQGRDTPHKTYLDLYRHIQESDEVIASCFNDWRRSTLHIKLSVLHENGLLTDAHIQKLSPEVQEKFRALKELQDIMSPTRRSTTTRRKRREGER